MPEQETVRSRVGKVLSGERPADRLPIIEWASWWDLTIKRWEGEGMPAGLGKYGVKAHFGLDMDYQHWFGQMAPGAQSAYSGFWIRDEADYDRVRPMLYPDPPVYDRAEIARWAAEQAAGQATVWISVSGFFWWPRVLFGIEPHFYAFYDYPKLMHRINQDQADYILRCLADFCEICTPDFMTFGEDMSYNHGPMLSKQLFDEFLAPYYRQVNPAFAERGIVLMVDSDGDVEPLIPWLEEVGLQGILPLERMAGVDVARIRANHPSWRMIGGYDKTVMHLGEARMRQEFERLLPVMRSGYYIPSVDHQTPPAVSTEDYLVYLRLLREYAERACG